MLTELHIQNIAIIEEQRVRFGGGFNIISGETGAGKSIILQALELVVGGKGNSKLVRTGADEATVTALLDLSGVPSAVIEELPELFRGDELSVTRVVPREGRGRSYLNGKAVTQAVLEDVMGRLITICGQGQFIRLLESRFHLELLDSCAGVDEILARYADAYGRWQQRVRELERIETASENLEKRREELTEIVDELTEAEVREGRRAELEADVFRQSNVERILETARRIQEALSGDQGVLEDLRAVALDVGSLVSLDQRLSGFDELLGAARSQLGELDRDLARYAATVELNEEALEAAREKLAEIARLERKYKTNEAGLCELLAESRDELSRIRGSESLDDLRSEVGKLEGEAADLANELSLRRERAAAKFAAEIERELREINLPSARFMVRFQRHPLRATGQESAEFLISTNKGEPLKPLAEIASGGELSRVMLVLKKVLRDSTGVNVLIFDEVDTGVSGKVARAVGEKLRELAQSSQVLCITHLAQVASLADRHLLVEKREGARTFAEVRELSKSERIDEIARMLAGYTITAATRESARELLTSNGS